MTICMKDNEKALRSAAAGRDSINLTIDAKKLALAVYTTIHDNHVASRSLAYDLLQGSHLQNHLDRLYDCVE